MTTTRWDLQKNVYTTNEENMLDCEGNIAERRYRKKIVLINIYEDVCVRSSFTIGSI